MNRRNFYQGSLAAAIAAALSGGQAFGSVIQALTQVTSNINAITGDGGDVVLEKAAVQELSDSLRGNLLLTGSEAYDRARRVLNRSIDKYPALIVQASGVADIQSAVTFARERDLLVAVKCGGHSFSGKSTCDGGMQIDLSHVRGVRIDPQTRNAFVEGGSHLADLDHEAMAQGLVTTAGTVSHTGVGGLTLGGGFGRLGRRFGLALDNVKAVDIVTADGQLRHASAEENPDLYWGVRGGGGNFGVVSSFEFALHPMQRTIIGGEAVFPIERLKEVLKLYAEMSANAPDDLYVDCYVFDPPAADGVAMIHVCYSGSQNKTDKVLAPLKKLGEPLNNTIKAMDYVAIQKSFDNADPRTGGDYMKSGFTSEISDDLINAIAEYFEPHPERLSSLFFQHSGGAAIGRVDPNATAFAHRYASHALGAVATWNPGADSAPHFNYVRQYWKELEPHTRGWYTNEISDEAQLVVNANYQGNFDRLLKVKDAYDPTNLFRLNANIRRAS